MTQFHPSDRDVNRAIRSWLHEDRQEDVSRIAGAVLDELGATPQRRTTTWWPARRTPEMNKFLAIGLGAAAVVVALLIGSNLMGPSSQAPGGAPPASVEPSVEPSEAAPSSAPSAPPLTQSFTSTRHGISLSYPEGWTAQVATEPWTESTFPLFFGGPHADWLSDPVLEADLFLAIASQPIGDSTPEDWAAEQLASDEGCGTTTEPIAFDGGTGLTGPGNCTVAVITADGRGYWIQLYTGGDDPDAVAPYDRAWFEEFLATVQVHPEDAVD